LMAAREDGLVEVREAISGKEVLTTSLFAKQLLLLNKGQREKEIKQRENSGVREAKPRDVPLNIATSPDGNWLATAGKDGNIYVWNIQDLWRKRDDEISLNKKLPGAGAVQSLAFSPESNLLASVGQDSSVRLWHLKNSTWDVLIDKPLLGHEGAVNALTFYRQHNRLRLATADSMGVTKIWQLPPITKLSKLQDLIHKLGAGDSANGDPTPLINEVRQYIGGLLAGR
jgi:WD40 repeat protein